MSSEPIYLRSPRRPLVRMTDTELLAALRGGEPSAFSELCSRHEAALRRSARSILRADPAVVDDVVQEALLRAHRALRRDDRHIDVRPYLFRIMRNCCLDEIARSRTDSVALHLLHPGDEPAATDTPHTLLEGRDRLTTTLADLADLPENQRHALLRREIDGLSHEQVATELGVTTSASRSLVLRARETLTRAAAARSADCDDIRADLLLAHDARRRASVTALRHVTSCSQCRAFRGKLKDDRRTLRVLAPTPLVLGGVLAGGKAIGLLSGASKPVGIKAVAAVTAAALAAGGAYELHAQVFGPGDRAPISAAGVALPNGHLLAGQRVPAHTALVTTRVRLPRSGPVPAVTLACPAGMRVAGLVPEARNGRSHGFSAATIIGASSVARVQFAGHGHGAGATAEIAMLCRQPDRTGSVRAAPAARHGMPLVHTCRRRATLSGVPGGAVAGTVTSHQPLAVMGARLGWLHVQTDGGQTGWVRAQVVC